MSTRRALGIALILGLAVGVTAGLWSVDWQFDATGDLPEASSAAEMPPIFAEITAAAGIDFQHWCGDSGQYFFPEVMGSGIALLDYNRDGRMDVFAVQGMPVAAASDRSPPMLAPSPTSRLYRQEATGQFTDVTVAAGLEDHQPYGMGVAAGDVNNDGWPDLYVSKFGSDRLFLNREGAFTDITASAGIDNPRWGTSACLVDFDRDGWLDLWVVNYVDYFPSQRCIGPKRQEDYCHPLTFGEVPAVLLRNVTGDSGNNGEVRFRDVSFPLGISAKPGPGLGVLAADLSGDGWPDLYAANDSTANFLWVNEGGQRFRDQAVELGVAYDGAGRPQSSMGIAHGDVDGDGRTDILLTHFDGEYDTLYLQVQPGLFEDRTAAAGLAAATFGTTGFGAALADLDLDGDLDLLVGNGRVRRSERATAEGPSASFWTDYAEHNQLFVNDGRGRFRESNSRSDGFLAAPHVTRGLATGDLDNDGDYDVVTSEVNGPARMFRNDAERQGNWLLVQAVDPRYGGRDAYGAIVTVAAGSRQWSRLVSPASSYLSSSDPRVHFGLSEAALYDRIAVHWPDGLVETFSGGPANALVTLRRGEGKSP